MTQEEYGKVYQHGYSRTVRLLRSRGASVDTAEDIAQAAWLQGWRKLPQLRDETTIMGWINTIAINYHRRGGKQSARFQVLFDIGGSQEVDSAPIDVARILEMCRPQDRILFELQLSGSTAQEIASQEGVSPTAIRIRFLRARRNVRASLESRGNALRESFLAGPQRAV